MVYLANPLPDLLLTVCQVVLSDYPAPAVLANISSNAKKAIPAGLESAYRIEGHEWGELNTDFSTKSQHQFECILAADCFWMPGQHLNLVRSMLHFLTLDACGRVFAIAAFHTGRAKVAGFFDVAAEEGLDIEDIYEENADGMRREWLKERDGGREDHNERKKWLAIAVLRRKT
jgi:predicted nicotinamide N-methyase